MDADEKNRYVLERVLQELESDPDFRGQILLHCRDGRIVVHEVRQQYRTDDLIDAVDPA